MNEASRAQGWVICAAAGLAALLFVVGILKGSYWALAIPVALVTLFALGLVAWVGYTIATIQVETDASPEILATDRTPSPSASPSPSTPSTTASASDTPSSPPSSPSSGKPAGTSPSTSAEDAA
jgi:hypothetical protein